jgi:hypothetical protein
MCELYDDQFWYLYEFEQVPLSRQRPPLILSREQAEATLFRRVFRLLENTPPGPPDNPLNLSRHQLRRLRAPSLTQIDSAARLFGAVVAAGYELQDSDWDYLRRIGEVKVASSLRSRLR